VFYDAGEVNRKKFLADPKNKDFKEPERSERVTVAPGRSLVSDSKTLMPGQTAMVSKEEAARFAKLGHIVGPDGKRVPGAGTGPAIGADGVVRG